MITEIISIGDELLIGKVTNTNASYLAKETKELGFECLYQTTVGDNIDHIREALTQALSRSNIILITGGLGPTEDDKTLEAIASYFQVDFEYRLEVAEHIQKIYNARNIIMPESNLKQAYLPVGVQILKNPVGTAPGIIWDVTDLLDSKEKKLIFAFPGVPYEMELMWSMQAKVILRAFTTKVIYEKYINFAGIGESSLIELLSDFMVYKDPKILPYANNFQVQLRVFSEHTDSEKAKQKVDETVEKIQKVCSKYIYGYDDDTLEGVVAKLLKEHKKTISLAESCTGGLISSRLTDVSGSSDYIKLNYVCYSNESKIDVLKLPERILNENGAVSRDTAIVLANNVREITGTDLGMAATGIAGPTGATESKPIGTVFLAISDKDTTHVLKYNSNPSLSRVQIKWSFSQYALDMIRKYLMNLL